MRDAWITDLRMSFVVGHRNAHARVSGLTGDANTPRPVPLWTRHMLGVMELERDRRRRRRPRWR